MKQVFVDLWETEIESPFPGLTTHAYLLLRNDGNVLFYNTSQQTDIEEMAKMGGVAYHFLSHRDELGDSIKLIHQRFDAKLGGHINELADFSEYRTPDISFTQREWLFDDIEVIPTPGHTPGSTCFYVQSLFDKTYLFTGDTLYFTDEGWKPGMLSFSDEDALFESLKLLRELHPDTTFSSAFSGSIGYEDVAGNWADKVQQAMNLL